MEIIKLFKKVNYRHLLPDLVIIASSMVLSLYLRLGGQSEFRVYLEILLRYLPIFMVLRVVTYFFLGNYNIIWRYVSVRDSVNLLQAAALSTLLIISCTFLLDLDRIPRSVYVIDGIVSFLGIFGIRVLRRYVFDQDRSRLTSSATRRILIFGAGETGLSLLKQYLAGAWSRGNVVGFIDDDPQKIGRVVSGLTVLGGHGDIPDIIRQYDVHEVVFAFRTATGDLIRQVLELTRPSRTQIRVLSDNVDVRGEFRSHDSTRRIELTDLLSRPERQVDVSRISGMLKGKRVLVTGAGGSIGSELCRQILSHGPSQLLLLDHSEFNLYQIDQELRSPTDDAGPVVPLLSDMRDLGGLRRVFEKYSPEIVFHAAAYKHVHLVEKNPFSAILTNVEGTMNLVRLCVEYQVATLVQISTDKAVNPVGLMGSTKRVCEMIVTTAGRQHRRQFCSVRFGNVLGSSGSFVPLLQKQIENGGPVTVTHPDMQRYLMLIPEAVSLVLNAAVLGTTGDVMLLRMGDPIRIVELARTLIALYGKTEAEIPIVFTGIRPGEKMCEELFLSGKEHKTENPDILVLPKGDAVSEDMTFDTLAEELARICESARSGEEGAVTGLRRLIQGNSTAVEQAKDDAEALVGTTETLH